MARTRIATTIALKARMGTDLMVSLLCNRYTVFILGVYAYSLAILALGGLGGVLGAIDIKPMWLFRLDATRGVYLKREYLELILLFYLYGYFHVILRPSRWRALLAAVPLLLAYLGQDIFFLMFNKIFRFYELAEVPELLRVLTWQYLTALLVFVVLPLGFFLWSINYRRFVILVAGILPLALLIGAAVYFPQSYINLYQAVGEEIVFWSDADTVANNGRFMTLLYREAELHLARAKTGTFRNRDQYDDQAGQLAGWIRAHTNKRNVHLLVMESFLDPTLFKGATFSKDPFHPSFRKLFGDKMGFSLSPVFAGKTAQAEFEALCGVPAFGEITGVEFNSFTGSPAYCLPGTLQLAGYQTMASNAYNPSFFNAPNAYRGIGFARVYFPREYGSGNDTYLSKGDTTGEKEYMFDGTIFAQNLEYIAPLLKGSQGAPLFNYILTIYGHFPHLLNEEKRPIVLKMSSDLKDEHLERAANQMFYRSQALADYVSRLIELDPKGLIIVVSDHLPPGQHGHRSYQKLHYLDGREESLYMNRILIIEEGKIQKLATIHHYDIPAVVLNSITHGAYCAENSCGFTQNKLLDDRMPRHDAYMRVMAHASE